MAGAATEIFLELITAGNRREYSIEHGDGEMGVYEGGLPGQEEISASNIHQ